MKLLFPAALALLAGVAAPVSSQMRDDLRGPTGHQHVRLPPGVKGATGGTVRVGRRCRMEVRHHHRIRVCRR